MTEEHNADNAAGLIFDTADLLQGEMESFGTVPQCMAPGCEQPIRARGHCISHYRKLNHIVNDPKNEYTWKILGDAGVVPFRAADERTRVDTAGFRDETLAKLSRVQKV